QPGHSWLRAQPVRMRLDEMPPADFNQEPEKSAFIAGGQAVIEVGTRRIRCLILPAQTFRPTGFVRHCPDESRTCFITRHVWDAVRGGESEAICRYCEGSRQRNARRLPRPSGLRPGRSAAALPSSTISTYGLRRAPCIRSVLATTHHAPSYETGSTRIRCPP